MSLYDPEDQKRYYPNYAKELYAPDQLLNLVQKAEKVLDPHLDEFDSIVVRGTSGTIFGGALSLAILKPLFVVRKPQEKSHSSNQVEGIGTVGRWIFADDFVFTGATLEACIEAIGHPPIAIYEYNYNSYSKSESEKFKELIQNCLKSVD